MKNINWPKKLGKIVRFIKAKVFQNSKENQIKCKHEWRILTNDQREGAGVSVCKKCGLWLSHSNRLQLDMNRHIMGFQKWISIIAIITSISALIVSVSVAIFK